MLRNGRAAVNAIHHTHAQLAATSLDSLEHDMLIIEQTMLIEHQVTGGLDTSSTDGQHCLGPSKRCTRHNCNSALTQSSRPLPFKHQTPSKMTGDSLSQW